MINPNDIVFLITTVIATAFLLYFSSKALHRKRNVFTKIAAWIGAFIFLALFLRLLSVSNPKFLISSDLFLLITVATIAILTTLLQNDIIKNPPGLHNITDMVNQNGMKSFGSSQKSLRGIPKGERSGKTKLISVPRHRQMLRLK